jgi:hypothetical protein
MGLMISYSSTLDRSRSAASANAIENELLSPKCRWIVPNIRPFIWDFSQWKLSPTYFNFSRRVAVRNLYTVQYLRILHLKIQMTCSQLHSLAKYQRDTKHMHDLTDFLLARTLPVRPPLWSTGQSSWLQIQRSRV